ncbi:hypothetical protein R6Z07F_007221 [Ovis aries]
MKVKNESEIAQSCPTLCDLMDCSLPGSSVYGIFQARVLEWGAIAFSVRIETVLFFLFPWFAITRSFWWGEQASFGSPAGKDEDVKAQRPSDLSTSQWLAGIRIQAELPASLYRSDY